MMVFSESEQSEEENELYRSYVSPNPKPKIARKGEELKMPSLFQTQQKPFEATSQKS